MSHQDNIDRLTELKRKIATHPIKGYLRDNKDNYTFVFNTSEFKKPPLVYRKHKNTPLNFTLSCLLGRLDAIFKEIDPEYD